VKTGAGDTSPSPGDYPGGYYPAVPDESAKPGTIITYKGHSNYDYGAWLQVGGTACSTTASIWLRLLTLEHLYHQSTSPPGVNDDETDGHYPGRQWLDTSANKTYICLDATNAAAVWKQTGGEKAITSTDFTMSTARLLGRSSASTGAVEEIQ